MLRRRLLAIAFSVINVGCFAGEIASTNGTALATILEQPFSMDAPEWSSSSMFNAVDDKLADQIVFNNLAGARGRYREMLERRQEAAELTFNFSGLPFMPLTVSIDSLFKDMKRASEARSATVRFAKGNAGSGFLDSRGRRAVPLEVLLNRDKTGKRLPRNMFRLTVEHN